MKGIVQLLVALTLFSACGDASKEASTNNSAVPVTASDSLYKAVMEGHDVAMARMGDIVRYKKTLQQRIDSLKGLKDGDSAALSAFEKAAKDLEAAEEGMNTWMMDFDPDAAGEKESDMLAFYTTEKEKVDTVKARIFRSIEAAQKLLQ